MPEPTNLQSVSLGSLLPGDLVQLPLVGGEAMVVSISDHPTHRGFLMVIWKMPKGFEVGGIGLEFSIDALSPAMVIDGRVQQTAAQRYLTLVERLAVPS